MNQDQSTAVKLLETYRTEIARCVKCGTCSAVCPTYRSERDESFSARGRMALIKAVLDGRLAESDVYRDRLATCLTCLACESSCPSAVPVTEIVQTAREGALESAGPGLLDRAVAAMMRHPFLFRVAAPLAPYALHMARSGVGGTEPSKRSADRARRSGAKGKVAFFPGCAVENMQPDIGRAVVTVIQKIGFDLVVPEGLLCCGKPLLSIGDRKTAAEIAVRNASILERCDADVIITACASCGLTFKREYHRLLPPGSRRPNVLDIHEFLAGRLDSVAMKPVNERVTIHDPCHLGRGQGLSQAVRSVLTAIPGCTLAEMREADRCCGFGGVMRITHRGLSDRIAEEKAGNILASGASLVATGCPGCRMQIATALDRRGAGITVIHPVQILERALADDDAEDLVCQGSMKQETMNGKEQRA